MSLADSSFQDQIQSPVKLRSNSLFAELAEEELNWSNSQKGYRRSIEGSEGENNPSQSPNILKRVQSLVNESNSMEVGPFSGEDSPHQVPSSANQSNSMEVGEESPHQVRSSANQSNSMEVGPFSGEENAKTVTLIGDSILSRDGMNMSSKISHYSLQVENESYAVFLNMVETSYGPMVKGFEILFQNIKELSSTYLEFLRLKHLQQQSISKITLGRTINNKSHLVYIDCKGLAQEIRSKLNQGCSKEIQFANNLAFIYQKVKNQFDSIKANLRAKEAAITELIKKIAHLGQEMINIMMPKNGKMKACIKEELLSTSYVRTKYMIRKEEEYFADMSQFLQRVTSYISFVCLELAPKSCLAIKEALLSFTEAASMRGSSIAQSKIKTLSSFNCYDTVFREMSKLLEVCIPSNLEIRVSKAGNEQDKLHEMIEAFIRESQSVVYLPVIEVEAKDYAYHSKNRAHVVWRRVDYAQKLKERQVEQFETQVVITHEGYLILELGKSEGEDKMATLKLANIKLARKNNQVILTDKGAGVLGYILGSNSILGSLVFEPLEPENSHPSESILNELIEEFIGCVKEVMQARKKKVRK